MLFIGDLTASSNPMHHWAVSDKIKWSAYAQHRFLNTSQNVDKVGLKFISISLCRFLQNVMDENFWSFGLISKNFFYKIKNWKLPPQTLLLCGWGQWGVVASRTSHLRSRWGVCVFVCIYVSVYFSNQAISILSENYKQFVKCLFQSVNLQIVWKF